MINLQIGSHRIIKASVNLLLSFLLFVGSLSFSVSAQSSGSPIGNGGFQPYRPSVVGGVPSESRGLEQPVYIADRSNGIYGATPGETQNDFSDFADNIQARPENSPSKIDYSRFHSGELVAVVGSDRILVGDLIDPKKLKNVQIDSTNFELELRKSLAKIVIRKALVQRFIQEQVAGKSIKERLEGERQIRTKVTQAFYDNVLPNLMKRQECETMEDFYKKLSMANLTMQALQKDYTENMLAQQCLRDHVNDKPTIELFQLSDYYEAHIDDYKRSAKVQFQALTALYSKFPDRDSARNAIAEMGNEVFFGSPFETVAKQKSSGLTASQGGFYDWTPKGALKSKPIDAAIFSLPLNELSNIIEDDDGCHIIRVLKRENEFTVPFTEVQTEIRKKLVEEAKRKEENEFTQKVREETPIWTKWPEDIPGSFSLSQLEGR